MADLFARSQRTPPVSGPLRARKYAFLGRIATSRCVVIMAAAAVVAAISAAGLAAVTGVFDSAPPYTITLLGNSAGETVTSPTDTVGLRIHANQAEPDLHLRIHDWSGILAGHDRYPVLSSVSGAGCTLQTNAIRCSLPQGDTTTLRVTYPTNGAGDTAAVFQNRGADVVTWQEAQLG